MRLCAVARASCVRSHWPSAPRRASESSMPRSLSVRRLLQLGLMRVYDPAHVQLAAEVATLGVLNHVRCVHRNVHEVRRTAQLILNQSTRSRHPQSALARRP